MSTDVPRNALKIAGEFNVAWFRSSAKIQRGFCSTCGASLFWDTIGSDGIWVGHGRIRRADGDAIEKLIFVADKGDYHEIRDGLPRNAR